VRLISDWLSLYEADIIPVLPSFYIPVKLLRPEFFLFFNEVRLLLQKTLFFA